MTTSVDMTAALGLAREVAAFAPAVYRIAEHLAAQRAQAVSADKACRYRGQKGAMCAVGCLIPDEEYDPEMEGSSALEVLEGWPDALEAMGIDSAFVPEVMDEIQSYHDSLRADPESPTYGTRLEEFKDRPDKELACQISADLSAIVAQVVGKELGDEH